MFKKLSPTANIWVKYTKFMIECAYKPDKAKRFINDDRYRRKKLGDFGMKIPKDVGICVDTSGQTWPAIYCRVKENHKPKNCDQYLVIELSHGATLFQDGQPCGSDPLDDNYICSLYRKGLELGFLETPPPVQAPIALMNITVEENLKDFDVFLRIPFIEATGDMLHHVKFDDETITLSCCS